MLGIELNSVTKLYEASTIGLKEVSLSIEPGEFVFVVGKSGAGKSTLLKLLSLQVEPTEGTIQINGTMTKDIQRKEIPFMRRRFGVVQKDFGLLEDRTIYENILFAMIATQQPYKGRRERVIQLLKTVGLYSKIDKMPLELSGGEYTCALIARALATNPSILILDEPTANLDSDSAWDIMCLLDDLNHEGITVVVASHAMDLVRLLKKRVVVLDHQQLVG